jgi:hypothetical protein
VNNVFLAVISAALLAMPLHAMAQEPTTPARADIMAPTESPNVPADPSTGKWVGDWQSRGRPAGSMEMDVDVQGDQVTGRVKSRCTPADPLEWAKLAGIRKGEKVFAQYDRGGRCGKVDVIYSIDREGKVMTGTWSNEYLAYGTLRLTK